MNKKIFVIAVLHASLIVQTIAFAKSSGKYADVNGMKVYYEIHGQAAPNTIPLIVLHGAYMNIPSMGAIIPKLAETHRVYALEFQGHGRTTDIDRPITYPNLADDVQHLWPLSAAAIWATWASRCQPRDSPCCRRRHTLPSSPRPS